jgi:hypothetical protein
VAGAAIKAQVVSFPPNGIDCEQLNVDITLVEVQQAFKKLKRHKLQALMASNQSSFWMRLLPYNNHY